MIDPEIQFVLGRRPGPSKTPEEDLPSEEVLQNFGYTRRGFGGINKSRDFTGGSTGLAERGSQETSDVVMMTSGPDTL